MKKRNVAFVIIISLVTFGIYMLYWLYSTRQEMVNKGAHIAPFWTLFSPLFFFILLTVLSTIFSGNDAASIIVFVGALGAIVGMFVVPGIWFWQYCKGANLITNGQLGVGLSYSVFWALTLVGIGFIWPGIVQDGFNKASTTA